MTTMDKVMEELQKQGFVPKKDEFGIVFKYQMVDYVCLHDERDEQFFAMYVPSVFGVDEENELDVLRAMNMINDFLKVVKMTNHKGHVCVCYESKLQKDADLEDIVPYAVEMLFDASKLFFEKLKEV